MSVVHRAQDLVLDREVAVKLFRSDVAVAADPRRIQAEMRMLARVNHPSLVTLHDASPGLGDDPAYLVMELVDGDDLGHLLPLPPGVLASIGAQVAAGLAHVHESGIVHRDVKPANVLVSFPGSTVRAKLADLGIARLVDSTRMTAVGTLLGTAAYLSPEQVLGEPPTPASDVYALGLLLIEGLTGRHPFPGTRGEVLAVRTVRPPRLPEGLTPADAALLASMTALDPTARISAAGAEVGLAAWSSPGPFSFGDPAFEETHASPTPTRQLPAPGPVTGETASLPAPVVDAAPAEETRSSGRPRSRTLALVGGGVVLLAALAGGLLLLPAAQQPAPVPSATYPAVDGVLGEHLRDLQKSVDPR
jgi:serine/threonine protein kinase